MVAVLLETGEAIEDALACAARDVTVRRRGQRTRVAAGEAAADAWSGRRTQAATELLTDGARAGVFRRAAARGCPSGVAPGSARRCVSGDRRATGPASCRSSPGACVRPAGTPRRTRIRFRVGWASAFGNRRVHHARSSRCGRGVGWLRASRQFDTEPGCAAEPGVATVAAGAGTSLLADLARFIHGCVAPLLGRVETVRGDASASEAFENACRKQRRADVTDPHGRQHTPTRRALLMMLKAPRKGGRHVGKGERRP
jgi:hypothetical protein